MVAPPQQYLDVSCMHALAGQLEAALALAHQRIAGLEVQVEGLEATVQSLKEALAATIGHAGHLQVMMTPLSRIVLLESPQHAHQNQDILRKMFNSFCHGSCS